MAELEVKNCPNCNSDQLSTDNPYGQLVCLDCGWIIPLNKAPLRMKTFLRPALRWGFIGFLFVFFVSLSVEFFIWKQFSFEAIWLQVRKVATGETVDNNLQLGAICNSLDKHECSIKYFNKVIDEDPQNKVAIANLAIAYAKSGQWAVAKPNFEAYFSIGGGAFDVAYWYGRVLMALGQEKEALNWMYYSLKLNPGFTEASVSLVQKLVKLKRMDEALGVIAAVTRGQPEKYESWQKVIDSQVFLNRVTTDKTEFLEFRTPSLDGLNYYFSVILNKNGRLKFFKVDERNRDNFVSLEVLDAHLINLPKEAKVKKLKLNDEKVEVSSFYLKNVTVNNQVYDRIRLNACRGCPTSLGRQFLENFSLNKEKSPKIDFLNVKQQ